MRVEVEHIPGVKVVTLRKLGLGSNLRLSRYSVNDEDWSLRLLAECIVEPPMPFAVLDALPPTPDVMRDIEKLLAAVSEMNAGIFGAPEKND